VTRDDLLGALSNDQVLAFLRVVRAGESSQDFIAYRTLYGGETFDSFADHPKRAITKNGVTSTAAGAYQFLARTWYALTKQYGFTDFSPASQDQGAVALIAGRHALEDVIAGRLDAAIRKCNREWASLPGSPYGQPTRTYAQAEATFLEYGGSLAAVGDVVPTVTKEVTMAPLVIPILSALSSLIPQLGSLFGGSEVAQRNVAAGSIVANAIVQATNAVNLQEAAERIQNDPQALQAARQAVADIWPSVTEVGASGIDGARKAAIAPDQLPFFKQGVFWITVGLVPLVYIIVLASLAKWEFIGDITSETRAQVIGTALGTLLGGIIGYFYGTSAGSARKTELMGGK
jgi:muramidase (phage lysozyme)